jgi:hypothetical protein
MQDVVGIVIPLGVEDMAGVGIGGCAIDGSAVAQQVCRIAIVLQHQVDMALRADLGADALAQRRQPGWLADGMHGIQAQAVDAVFLQPVQCILAEELGHFGAAEIDGRAPQGLAVMPEEIRRIAVQVVAVRPEVVVDHIQEHHHAQAVGGIDQCLELIGVP